MRFIDLSIYLEENKFAEPFPVSIKFHPHAESAKHLAEQLGLKPEDFNDGLGLTHEDFAGQFQMIGTILNAYNEPVPEYRK